LSFSTFSLSLGRGRGQAEGMGKFRIVVEVPVLATCFDLRSRGLGCGSLWME